MADLTPYQDAQLTAAKLEYARWGQQVEGIVQQIVNTLTEGKALAARFDGFGEAATAQAIQATCGMMLAGAAAVGYDLTGSGLSDEQIAAAVKGAA